MSPRAGDIQGLEQGGKGAVGKWWHARTCLASARGRLHLPACRCHTRAGTRAAHLSLEEEADGCVQLQRSQVFAEMSHLEVDAFIGVRLQCFAGRTGGLQITIVEMFVWKISETARADLFPSFSSVFLIDMAIVQGLKVKTVSSSYLLLP